MALQIGDKAPAFKAKDQNGKLISSTDLKGKNIVLLDDIVDTAGTITKAADVLLENGANSVIGIATHPVLSPGAQERIDASGISKFYFLSSLKVRITSKKIRLISPAPLFGEAIKEHMTPGGSVSKLFIQK